MRIAVVGKNGTGGVRFTDVQHTFRVFRRAHVVTPL